MSPVDVLCQTTEPHRKKIGWVSIIGGISLSATLTIIATMEHYDTEYARAKIARHNANISRLEDSIRDLVALSDRPIVIYHAGSAVQGDETVVSWPPSAETLLGWTLDDVNTHGLGIMMPSKEDHVKHNSALEAALKKPPGKRKTSIIFCNAKTKDGSILPVRITVWVVGNQTRSVAAVIEAQSQVVEQHVKN